MTENLEEPGALVDIEEAAELAAQDVVTNARKPW